MGYGGSPTATAKRHVCDEGFVGFTKRLGKSVCPGIHPGFSTQSRHDYARPPSPGKPVKAGNGDSELSATEGGDQLIDPGDFCLVDLAEEA